MSNLIPFQFHQTPVRIIILDDGSVLYVAKDVAAALGYTDTVNAVKLHCKHAKSLKDIGVAIHHPQQNQQLDPQTKVIPESDVNRLIMRSKLPSAEIFQDWLAEEVIPNIRKTGSYSLNKPVAEQLPPTMPQLQIAESVARTLRMSQTSALRMYAAICEDVGISSKFLPAYSDEQLTKALGDLLRDHGSNLSAVKANPILERMGLLEKLERRASKGETKSFWSITEAGKVYGKNETSPQNPRETQPRWYVDKFNELLSLIEDSLSDV